MLDIDRSIRVNRSIQKQTDPSIFKRDQYRTAVLNSCFSLIHLFVVIKQKIYAHLSGEHTGM